MNQNNQNSSPLTLIRSIGPWPFVTKTIYQKPDHSRNIWQSRRHRKGLPLATPNTKIVVHRLLTQSLWQPRQLNWWIANFFAIGSILFMLGGVLSLDPSLAKRWSLDVQHINLIFFSGSIPFTTAAYLQLFQAANGQKSPSSGKPSSRRRLRWFGWNPCDVGWLSCALQFPGTLLFNLETLDALLPNIDWLWQDLVIWAPNFLGSLLFLASGYLAFIETCHRYWAWELHDLSWWVTYCNFLGCIGFMVAAVFAVILPQTPVVIVTIAMVFTFLGAFCFFLGSALMLPEAAWPVSESNPS
jgi:hypothetical protein